MLEHLILTYPGERRRAAGPPGPRRRPGGIPESMMRAAIFLRQRRRRPGGRARSLALGRGLAALGPRPGC